MPYKSQEPNKSSCNRTRTKVTRATKPSRKAKKMDKEVLLQFGQPINSMLASKLRDFGSNPSQV